MSRAVDYSLLAEPKNKKKKTMIVKVAMIGDSQIGKTSLMVNYVDGNFDEDYIQTLGVNFMEKTIVLRNTDVTFSIWDLGGQREYLHMLPLVCNDAVALLFMFDLTRKPTLTSIKDWYKQARLLNKTARPFLIGTKFDVFSTLPLGEKQEITKQARKFAKAMKASLLFCSASHSINVHKIFKVVVAKVFDLQCTVSQITDIGEAIVEYEQRPPAARESTDDVAVAGVMIADSVKADMSSPPEAVQKHNSSPGV